MITKSIACCLGVLLFTLLTYQMSTAQVINYHPFEQKLLSAKVADINFEHIKTGDSRPVSIHIDSADLLFNSDVPKPQDNDDESGYYSRSILYGGKTFSIDSGSLHRDNYLIGQWLDLFRCMSYKHEGFQYLFTQWYLHFTNGAHPPSLITILVFKEEDYLGCLNYLSEYEDFEDLAGYYNGDSLIDIPIITRSSNDTCRIYHLYSIEPTKSVRFIRSEFDDRDSIVICN